MDLWSDRGIETRADGGIGGGRRGRMEEKGGKRNGGMNKWRRE